MRLVKCDKCGKEYNPVEENGMTISIGTISGSAALDFCNKHSKALFNSLNRYTNGRLTQNETGEEMEVDIQEDSDGN